MEPPESFAVDPQYSSSLQRMRKGFTPGLHGCLSADRIIFSIVYKSVTVDALLINRIAGPQEIPLRVVLQSPVTFAMMGFLGEGVGQIA